jgi:hypothetical protein
MEQRLEKDRFVVGKGIYMLGAVTVFLLRQYKECFLT